jgi:secreted trypsin-like serine protease
MKVSALLLTQLLAFSAEARLHDQTRKRTREMETKATKDIDRIINGVEADEDRYSYIVSLHDNQGHFCGASLIAKDIVLSAAHCAGAYTCRLHEVSHSLLSHTHTDQPRISPLSFLSQVVAITPLSVGTNKTIKMETK